MCNIAISEYRAGLRECEARSNPYGTDLLEHTHAHGAKSEHTEQSVWNLNLEHTYAHCAKQENTEQSVNNIYLVNLRSANPLRLVYITI